MKLAAVVVVGGGGTRGGDEEGGGVSKASPTNSVSSDLGAAASALFNMRSSPVVMSQKQIHSHNKNMPFLSLSPPVMAAPVSSSFQATRQRSQTWDASNSNLASPGFLQELVDTDTTAAGTLCALMQSDSPLITSLNAKPHQHRPSSMGKRQRSQSVAAAASAQQERQISKGLRPRSLSSMDHSMTSPVLFASSKRRPSRTMSMDSSLLGEEEYYEYYDEDEDEDEEEDDSGGDDGEVGTVVSLEIVGKYSPDSRRLKIERFADKRRRRIWRKRIKYDVRKNFADSRLRVKGRFVRKEDEDQLRDYLNMT